MLYVSQSLREISLVILPWQKGEKEKREEIFFYFFSLFLPFNLGRNLTIASTTVQIQTLKIWNYFFLCSKFLINKVLKFKFFFLFPSPKEVDGWRIFCNCFAMNFFFPLHFSFANHKNSIQLITVLIFMVYQSSVHEYPTRLYLLNIQSTY